MKMNQIRYETLRSAVGRFDAEMRRLADLGIDLHRPPRELLADLRSRHEDMRRRHEELQATQREADRLLLAELLDIYIGGDDEDREAVRALLREYRTFRWAIGWGLGAAIRSADDARKALAVLSMKDGGSDSRDQIVALDQLCKTMRAAGLSIADLLCEGARWSSAVARFAPAASTRDLLLRYADRFP